MWDQNKKIKKITKFQLKELLRFYIPYRGLFIIDIVCAFAAAATGLMIPLGVKYIMEQLLGDSGFLADSRIIWAGGILVGLIALQTVCGFIMDAWGHAMGAMMEGDVRNELFRHCGRLSFRFYDEHRIGELMSRITNDSTQLTEFFHHFPEDLVVNSVKLIGAWVILFTINPYLTVLIFLFLPVMLAYMLYFNKKRKIALIKSRENISEINSQVEDSLAGIRVVQSFANEVLEEEKFARENSRFAESRIAGYRSEAFVSSGSDVFVQIIPLAVIFGGGTMMVKGMLNLPDLLVFLMYVDYLTAPIRKIIHMTQQFQEGVTGFNRFMEVMETEPEVKDRSDALALETVKGHIELKHVDFCYSDGTAVLEDVNLDIRAGEYLALVGASGAGKTTLCSLIPRFYDVTGGSVSIDGVDVRQVTLRSLRRKVGVVQQDVYLFSGTVAENIRYGKPGASMDEVVESAKQAGAHEFIMGLQEGYDTNIGPHGVKLSGGQQQRLSIARVFLKNPPVLILDEATSALDNESERIVQESLERLSKNRTTIVIAHRLSTIRKVGRIVVLNGRGISEEGTHEQLLARGGAYSGLYHARLEE